MVETFAKSLQPPEGTVIVSMRRQGGDNDCAPEGRR
jgi:hypothetical protein